MPLPSTSPVPFELPADELVQLQLRVARRADEIAQTQRHTTVSNFHCWLLAEAEVLKAESGLSGFGWEPLMARAS
jgi:hypothetical protein